jgi:hypothetical protein
MKEEFTADDIKWLIDELSKIQTRTPFVEQVGLWCEEQLRVQKSQPGSEEFTTNERLGARFDMIPQLKRVEKANDWQDNWDGHAQDLCRRCGFVPDDPFQPEVLCLLPRSLDEILEADTEPFLVRTCLLPRVHRSVRLGRGHSWQKEA